MLTETLQDLPGAISKWDEEAYSALAYMGFQETTYGRCLDLESF